MIKKITIQNYSEDEIRIILDRTDAASAVIFWEKDEALKNDDPRPSRIWGIVGKDTEKAAGKVISAFMRSEKILPWIRSYTVNPVSPLGLEIIHSEPGEENEKK